jgi:hypothetical protein
MVVLDDVAQVEALSIHLETMLVSVQDRCTVSAERTTGSEIVLDAPDVTTR